MSIRIEFYGIARRRVACADAVVEVDGDTTLGNVLQRLGERFPALARECLDDEKLRCGYLANIGGERFVRDPQTALSCGTTLLIMSADAGG